ncbi:MAG TPA: MG2 domain-containing protein, partial [Verrucomicrobiales bacterium]|nr:MG2 domain-containing protein [Verrucomicrobiales bacterium]
MSGADARQPGITLFCNDEVTPEAVAKLAYFRNEAGQTVEVKAEALTVGALGKYPPAFGKWNDRKGGAARDGEDAPDRGPLPPPEAPALSAVRVYPASLLPPGNGWSLIVPRDLANAGGSAKTQKPYISAYGSIPVMQVAGVEAEPVLDGPRELHVSFNKSIAELKGPEWERFISVEPKPAGLAWEASGRQVTLKGKFEHGTPYVVKVLAGAPALDQTTLGAVMEKKVQFEAHPPHLSLPSFDAAQWLGGRGSFEFATANLKGVSVKVKRITPDRAVDALRGYAVYEHDESKKDNYENTRVPYAAISGKTVWEKEFPSKVELDHSERNQFTWDEISGGKRAPGMYFVNIEGDPKEEVGERKRLGSQTLVQLTDIGLAWKVAGREALLFVFSHTTGQPIPGVTLQSFTDENDPVEKQTTGADGMARMQIDKSRWLLAQKDADLHGIALGKDMPELDMWSFELPYTERAPDKAWKEMLLFTERPVYQPGETVFFKAIQRMHSAEGLSLPPANEPAKLALFDPQHRLILERDVKFSESGTLADTLRMPAQGVGWYQMKITFPPVLKPGEKAKPEEAAEEGEEGEDSSEGSRGRMVFEQQILVQEYQPNAFRIDFDNKAVVRDGDSVKVPLNAAYLMGKPLSEAEVTWTSRIAQ